MTKSIPLTQGKQALVDDEDFEYISRWKWFYAQGYACKTGVLIDGISNGKRIFMHHLIIPKQDKMDVDHINGDKLDNRRSNLRLCTHQNNMRNSVHKSTGTSRYKGVSWHKYRNKYQAKIMVDGKQIYLGLHQNAEDAAKVYDRAAKFFFGEFANLNFKD